MRSHCPSRVKVKKSKEYYQLRSPKSSGKIIFSLLLTLSITYSLIVVKPLEQGLTYSQEVRPKLKIHVLKLFKGCSNLKLEAHLAKNKVLHSLVHKENKETLSHLNQRLQGLAAINGDFFMSNGIPIGAMMIKGELIRKPYQNRPVFAWGNEKRVITSLEWSAQLIFSEKINFCVKGFNEPCPDNGLSLYTPSGDKSLAKLPARHYLFKADHSNWLPNTEVNLTLEKVIESQTSVEVPLGYAIITARGLMCQTTDWFHPGHCFKLSMQTKEINPQLTPFMIGGGPWLCKDSQIYIDWKEQNFRMDVHKGRHPRSAIGYNKEGDILLAVVEGRTKESQGVSLQEMSEIMLKLGCSHAMNLDGGGSSSMNFSGRRFSDLIESVERPIGNAFVIQSVTSSLFPGIYKIIGPSEIKIGQILSYQIQDEFKNSVPSSQVQWIATNHLKIKPDGEILALKSGKATIQALVKGIWIDFSIIIQPISKDEIITIL